jgi:hypothetical protein
VSPEDVCQIPHVHHVLPEAHSVQVLHLLPDEPLVEIKDRLIKNASLHRGKFLNSGYAA